MYSINHSHFWGDCFFEEKVCRKIPTFLQVLRETGWRSGEAIKLEWNDLNTKKEILSINNPEKNGLLRQFKISEYLLSMRNLLPKISKRIFGDTLLNYFRKNFMNQRKRIA